MVVPVEPQPLHRKTPLIEVSRCGALRIVVDDSCSELLFSVGKSTLLSQHCNRQHELVAADSRTPLGIHHVRLSLVLLKHASSLSI